MTVQHVIGIICAICLAGCAGRAGQMKTSPELTRAFEEGRPPPESDIMSRDANNYPMPLSVSIGNMNRRPDSGGKSNRNPTPWTGRYGICFPIGGKRPGHPICCLPMGISSACTGPLFTGPRSGSARITPSGCIPRVSRIAVASAVGISMDPPVAAWPSVLNGWNGWAAVNRVTNACGSWSSS